MKHELPDLPYALSALEPHVSAETLQYHHGKHHAKYVSTLNELIAGTEFESMPLEQIVQKSSGKVFNNAAQAWNHDFFWNCLGPDGGGEPQQSLAEAIDSQFGSFKEFQHQFSQSATTLFGSGWTWLVQNRDGKLTIENTSNAGTPLTEPGKTPLMTCDVWEHAYYIDYRNARPSYVEAFWKIVNWEAIARRFPG